MRDYYNRRVGKEGEQPRLTLAEVAEQLGAAYDALDQQGYFQKSFGYDCVDAGAVAGEHGTSIFTHFYLNTGIRVAPFHASWFRDIDEVGLFTVVEFLYDHMAKPDQKSGRYHNWSGCGWHFDLGDARFDVAAGRKEWREKVNRVLKFYGEGYELSLVGEVVHLAPHGFEELLQERAPATAAETDAAKLIQAIRVFQLARSSREERKQAVRELADLLEFHREPIKAHLRPDEHDLFNIANNFAIRHHRRDQKDDYDDRWLAWMFYTYLATVRLTFEIAYGPAAAQEEHPEERRPVEGQSDDDELPF